MRIPVITSISSIQPRTLLLLLLLAGGVMLSLSAATAPPHDTHGTEEHGDDHGSVQSDDYGGPGIAAINADHAEIPDSSHATDDQAPAANQADEELLGTEVIDTTEDAYAAEGNGDEEAHDESGIAATEEHSSPTMLGVNLGSLNVVSPRLIVIVVGLTLLVALAGVVVQSAGLLAVIVGLSVVGFVASIRESMHAGEELGIFVPLPILPAIIYGGAGLLAAIQLAEMRGRSAVPHDAHG